MKKLLVFLKHYKKETVLAPLFKLLEASFELMVPLIVSSIIDVGIANKDSGYIIRMSIILAALSIIGLTCSLTAQFYSAKAAVGFASELRHALFAHIQTLSFTEMDKIGNSTLITRMTSDIQQTQSGVNLVLRLFLRSPFIVFGAMIMAFTVDVKAAFIFVIAIPLLSVIVFGIMMFTMPLYNQVQQKLDRILGITRENLTGVRVIRAFNKEQEETQKFFEFNDSLASLQKYVGKISGLMNPATLIVVNFSIIALIYTGAVRVNIGVLTQGQVVALVNYMSQILVELIKLANLIITVTKSIASGNRIQSVLEVSPSLVEAETVVSGNCFSETAVVFKDVSLTYAGSSEAALEHISFIAKRGETIGIIGGTGSGKSSLVHMIPRFYDASEGEIEINGMDIKKQSLSELRNSIGIVMQKSILFKGSIGENLRWARKDASDEELWKALEIAQAKDFVEEKPGQLNASVEQGGKNFSGGQKQRLSIARALVRQPGILILDDSASALDFVTDARLRSAIRQMETKPTVFIVSQRTSSIQHADKILVLDDGKMVGIGTHEELLEQCAEYQEIHYSQFKKEEI